MLTIRLKRHADNQISAINFAAARLDGAAVDHDGGSVEASHCHDHPRHVLVASRQRDVAVVPLSTHHCLNAVCNDVSGRQTLTASSTQSAELRYIHRRKQARLLQQCGMGRS